MVKKTSATITLKVFKESYINDEYLSWLNDKEVTKFLEIRFQKQTSRSALSYIKSFKNNKNKVLWAIFSKSSNNLIGTINLYDIDKYHLTSKISVMIGDKSYWGKAAYQALVYVISYSFKKLKLRKVIAGTYENNIGMNFTLNKLGFKIEGRLKKSRLWTKNNYVDELIWGLFKKDFNLE